RLLNYNYKLFLLYHFLNLLLRFLLILFSFLDLQNQLLLLLGFSILLLVLFRRFLLLLFLLLFRLLRVGLGWGSLFGGRLLSVQFRSILFLDPNRLCLLLLLLLVLLLLLLVHFCSFAFRDRVLRCKICRSSVLVECRGLLRGLLVLVGRLLLLSPSI